MTDQDNIPDRRKFKKSCQHLLRANQDKADADDKRRNERKQKDLRQLAISQPEYHLRIHAKLPQDALLPLLLLPVTKNLRR